MLIKINNKILTTILILILFFIATPFTSKAENKEVFAFVSAYDLQNLCVQDISEEGEPNLNRYYRCEAYILGVLDTVYLATTCEKAASYLEVLDLLVDLYKHIPDANLKKMPAVQSVYHVWSVTESGISCLKK